MPLTAEATVAWRRSTYCADGICIEVAEAGDDILVRDSKNPGGQNLRFERQVWMEFIEGVKHGEFIL